MNTHGPMEREVVGQMRALSHAIIEVMPEGYGFVFLTFKFGEVRGARMNYMSNAKRADMLTALKELVANMEGRVFEPPRGKQ